MVSAMPESSPYGAEKSTLAVPPTTSQPRSSVPSGMGLPTPCAAPESSRSSTCSARSIVVMSAQPGMRALMLVIASPPRAVSVRAA